MEEYTFEQFWEDLNNGFQIYFTYMKKRYLLYKTAKNCYTQELVEHDEKTPHPKFTVITLKKVKELFPYIEDIEYKI